MHNYANEIYNGKIPRLLQPVAQNRRAIYIKPLGEALGEALPEAFKQSSKQPNVQNGHQADPKSLYTTPYDNVGNQGPWIPTIRNNTHSNFERKDKLSTKKTKFSLDKIPRKDDFLPKPFGDTVLQTSLRVSGNKAKETAGTAENDKTAEAQTSTETVRELSTSSANKYYYYFPTSFPSNQNPYPPKRYPPKTHNKRPRADINKIAPQTQKRYIPASTVSERKDYIPVSKAGAKTVYYHSPTEPETLTRPERDCKFVVSNKYLGNKI